MAENLFVRLEARLDELSSSERAVAGFILSNRTGMAFETAASIAKHLGVSVVTVWRFCRTFGYRSFKELRADLKQSLPERSSPWPVGQELKQFLAGANTSALLRKSLEIELSSLVEVYSLTSTPGWREAVELLATSKSIHVAGFQTERGLARTLAHYLQYTRPGVTLVDTEAGNYADVFTNDAGKSCLVVIDIRRYSKQAYLLAERAKKESIPLIVITDRHCDWASKFTPLVLAASTQSGLFWSSFVSLSCVVNLLINEVVAKRGPAVEKRLSKLSDLYRDFTGFVGSPDGRARRGRPR